MAPHSCAIGAKGRPRSSGRHGRAGGGAGGPMLGSSARTSAGAPRQRLGSRGEPRGAPFPADFPTPAARTAQPRRVLSLTEQRRRGRAWAAGQEVAELVRGAVRPSAPTPAAQGAPYPPGAGHTAAAHPAPPQPRRRRHLPPPHSAPAPRGRSGGNRAGTGREPGGNRAGTGREPGGHRRETAPAPGVAERGICKNCLKQGRSLMFDV